MSAALSHGARCNGMFCTCAPSCAALHKSTKPAVHLLGSGNQLHPAGLHQPALTLSHRTPSQPYSVGAWSGGSEHNLCWGQPVPTARACGVAFQVHFPLPWI